MFCNKVKLITFLSLTTTVTIAGTMGAVCNEKVTIPCSRNAFSLGAQALYFKPSFSGDNYAWANFNSLGNQNNYSIAPWQWGFEIDGSYLFNTGNDLSINWYHWNNTAKALINNGVASTFITRYSDTLSYPVLVTNQPMWDGVNLEFGQSTNFGPSWSARFHGGATFAKIKNTYIYAGNTVSLTSQYGSVSHQTFTAGGARAGADFNYEKIQNLSIYSKTAFGLLVGTSKFNQTALYTTLSLSEYTYGSSTTISPEIDEKLGLQYNLSIPQGSVIFDLGWMWINYFNPLERPNYSALSATDYYDMSSKSSNFGFQGLYFGLKVIGNSFV